MSILLCDSITVFLQCCPPSMAVVWPASSPCFSCRRRLSGATIVVDCTVEAGRPRSLLSPAEEERKRQEWRKSVLQSSRFWPIRTRTTYGPHNFWLVERTYPAGWMAVVHLFCTVVLVGIGQNWGDCNILSRCLAAPRSVWCPGVNGWTKLLHKDLRRKSALVAPSRGFHNFFSCNRANTSIVLLPIVRRSAPVGAPPAMQLPRWRAKVLYSRTAEITELVVTWLEGDGTAGARTRRS